MIATRTSSTTDNAAPASAGHGQVLLVAIGSRSCSIPLGHVLETMRPLPIEPVAGVPAFVLGLSVIRGTPIPVVDLAAALGAPGSSAPSRFVVLKIGDRRVALAVGAVLGVRAIDATVWERVPPLLGEVSADVLEAIGALDAELLLALRTARLVTDEVWRTLDKARSGP
jgi:purine-binding chemotaxis protein CheW